jgi:NADH dehydrogenase
MGGQFPVIDGKPRTAFVCRNYATWPPSAGTKPSVTSLDSNQGYLAWWFWLAASSPLIGFRNRLTVMTQWAFSYLTYSARRG